MQLNKMYIFVIVVIIGYISFANCNSNLEGDKINIDFIKKDIKFDVKVHDDKNIKILYDHKAAACNYRLRIVSGFIWSDGSVGNKNINMDTIIAGTASSGIWTFKIPSRQGDRKVPIAVEVEVFIALDNNEKCFVSTQKFFCDFRQEAQK